MHHCRLLICCWLGISILVGAAGAADAKQPVWSRKGTDLFTPAFSPDGHSVAFVIQGHYPDGGDAIGMKPEVLQKYADRAKTEPRWNDPLVVILDLQSGQLREVDYGWSPCFSPDGKTLAYSRQVQVLTGSRTLADTVKGNAICFFHLNSGKIDVVAKPDQEYYDSPLFSPDGKKLAFCQGGHANGAMEGNIGVILFDLESRMLESLPPPNGWVGAPFPKSMTTVMGKAFSGGKLIVSYHQLEEFQTESVRGVVSYNPGPSILRKSQEPCDLRVLSNDDVCIGVDGNWENVTKGVKFARLPEDSDEGDDKGFYPASRFMTASLSPKGDKLARIDRHKLRIYDAPSGRELEALSGQSGAVNEIHWRNDEAVIAVVTTPREQRFTDELYLFETKQ